MHNSRVNQAISTQQLDGCIPSVINSKKPFRVVLRHCLDARGTANKANARVVHCKRRKRKEKCKTVNESAAIVDQLTWRVTNFAFRNEHVQVTGTVRIMPEHMQRRLGCTVLGQVER
jgi:hypothetical protein